ncbi:MAG: hypothetical protein EHM28_15565 [Spirochaetaceae bacterium]|nr:MAG: hypothetical protein EHM28_15565 [Spirochaetaceae bacterium]
MGKKAERINVLSPLSLRELGAWLKEYPAAVFMAGGSDLIQKYNEHPHAGIPDTVISLSQIDELGRIKRKEQGIEIGACVPMSRILSTGQNIVPRILLDAIARIATPSVRNLATIGGNICMVSPFSDVLVPLVLLEAKLEIRGPASHFWMPLTRFLRTPGRMPLLSSEILASVAIPVIQPDVQVYRKLEVISIPTLSVLTFAAMARIFRNTVTDFRIVYGGLDPLFMRNRELESSVTGRKIPLSLKFREQYEQKTREFIQECDPGFLPDRYHRNSAIRLTRLFLEKVSTYRTD